MVNSKYWVFLMAGIAIFQCKLLAQGTLLYDNSYVHKIVFEPYYEDVTDTLTNNYILSFGLGQIQTRKIPYLPTAVQIDGEHLDSVGLRYKGFNSWWNAIKKPMKIDLNEYVTGRDYDGIRKFNLHNGSGDPSFLRENISFQLFRELGIKVPRTAYAEVYINQDYIGIFRMVEQVDNVFLQHNFGNNSGNLYGQNSPNTSGFSLEWRGNDPALYLSSVSLENHQTQNDWTDLIHFLDVLNNTPDENFKTAILSVFDVYEYLKILAVDVLLNNVDYYGYSGRNYYLYDNKEGDGKFHWIPWDYNLTWFQDPGNLKIDRESYPVLINRILKVPEFYEYYLYSFCEIRNKYTPGFVSDFIQKDTALIRKFMLNDPNLDYPLEAFDKNQDETWDQLPGLKPYASHRINELNSMLLSENVDCNSNSIPEDKPEIYFRIFPVPANQTFTVSLSDQMKQCFYMTNMQGKILRELEIGDGEQIDISWLSAGLYLLKSKSNPGVIAKLSVVH